MKKITVYISEETDKKLKEMADADKRGVSFIADKMIQKGIKETERKKIKPDGLQPGKD